MAAAAPQGCGEYDAEGDVDRDDADDFYECMVGPDVPPTPSLPQTAAECIQAFDSDGDGDIDVVAASVFALGAIVWFENTDGRGTFGAQRAGSLTGAPRSVFAPDLDADGGIDVLAPADPPRATRLA